MATSKAGSPAAPAAGDAGDEGHTGKRVRKTHPGPKDAAQERRERLHAQHMEIKGLREAMSDLRATHETATKVLKLEHQRELDAAKNEHAEKMKMKNEELESLRTAYSQAVSKQHLAEKATADWQNNCAQWAEWKKVQDAEKVTLAAQRAKEMNELRSRKDNEVAELKDQLATAKAALARMTEAAQETMGREMTESKACKIQPIVVMPNP